MCYRSLGFCFSPSVLLRVPFSRFRGVLGYASLSRFYAYATLVSDAKHRKTQTLKPIHFPITFSCELKVYFVQCESRMGLCSNCVILFWIISVLFHFNSSFRVAVGLRKFQLPTLCLPLLFCRPFYRTVCHGGGRIFSSTY